MITPFTRSNSEKLETVKDDVAFYRRRLYEYRNMIAVCEKLGPTLTPEECEWLLCQDHALLQATTLNDYAAVLHAVLMLVHKTLCSLHDLGVADVTIGKACGINVERVKGMVKVWRWDLDNRVTCHSLDQ